jgi:hypothetical protein
MVMKNRPEQVPEITEMVKRALVCEERTCAGYDLRDFLGKLVKSLSTGHCEERSDEAIT